MANSEDKASPRPEAGEASEFASVKERLEQIAEAVSDEGISLDEALDLYEEAVSLGLRASDLLEVGVPAEGEGAEASGEPGSPDGPGKTEDAASQLGESPEPAPASATEAQQGDDPSNPVPVD